MFVFNLTGPTAAGNFYCAVLFFLIILPYRKRCATYPIYANNGKAGVFALLITFFAVTACYTGDFFGYKELVKLYDISMDNYHLEPIYQFIIVLVNNNYVLFRTIVWGGSVLCIMRTAKTFNTNVLMTLFIMFLLFTTQFCYARATLAMSVYFLGLSVFLKGQEYRRPLVFILGLALLMCSYLFHKSMLVVIALTIFCFIPITKKTIVPILLGLLILSIGIDTLTSSFQDALMSMGDTQLSEKIEQSRELDEGRQSVNATFFGWISLIWEYVPFYLTFIIVAIEMLKKDIQKGPMVGIFRVTFAIVVMSTMLLFFSTQSFTYFYRYLYMSFIPLSILTVYLVTNRRLTSSKYKTIIYACGGYNIWFFFSYILRLF